MKTFEEAMELRQVHGDEECGSKLQAMDDKYESIIEEIGQSETASQFIFATAELMATAPLPGLNDRDRFLSLMMSLFINGVMVGIEMEKAE